MLELSLEFSRLTVPPVLDLAFAVYPSGRFPRVAVLSSVFCLRTLRTSIIALILSISAGSLAKAATIFVPADGDLQGALNNAQCGDTVVISAGATFVTSADLGFVFPAKQGGPCTGTAADTITVITANVDSLPPAGKRVGIGDAANMPKLVTTGPTPAIGFPANSRFWKLIGLEVTTVPSPQYTQFLGFVGSYVPLAQVPSDITFDRCYIHSQEDGTNNAHASARAGVDVHAARVTFSGCRLALPAGYQGPSQNSDNNYAILMGKGPGPLTIDNCFLNGWFTAVFLGGSTLETNNTATVAAGATLSQATLSNVDNLNVGDMIALPNQNSFYEVVKVTGISGNTVNYVPWGGNMGPGSPLSSAPVAGGLARWNGLNPANVTITHNTFYINPAIASQISVEIGQVPKGYFEFKSVDGLYMEGNDFMGWPANFTVTVRNQGEVNGCDSPWSVIRHFTFKNNRESNLVVPHVVQLFGLQLEDNICTSTRGGDVQIVNNLFTSGGWLADVIGGDSITVRHNTILNNGTGIWSNGRLLNGIFPASNVKFNDNIAFNNEYGVYSHPPFDTTWNGAFPNLQMSGNVLISRTIDPFRPNCSNAYPAGNFCPLDQDAVGFAAASSGNYRLLASSLYHNQASDGSDPGMNQDALEAALAGGSTTPTPTPTPMPSPTPSPSPNGGPAVGSRVTVDVDGSFIRSGPSISYGVIGTQGTMSRGTVDQPCVNDPASSGVFCHVVFDAAPNGWVTAEHLIVLAAFQIRLVTLNGDQNGSLLAINIGRETAESSVSITTLENFGADKRTRLMIFAVGVSGNAANTDPSNDIVDDGVVIPNLAESVIIEAHTPDGRVYRLPVEFAGAQGSVPSLDQVNVVLVPELQGAGTVDLTLIVNGQRSNAATIMIS